jgi:4-aminobutyrate aminotransferase-like enzyme
MAKTIAQSFYEDPRIKEAKKLIAEALEEHQKKIQGMKPSSPELKVQYDELLKKFGEQRGGPLFYQYLGSGFGKGALVELADGSVKYDFITGIGVHFMGHSHPKIMEAQIDGALSNTVMNGHLQQNVDSAKLVNLMSSEACKNGAEIKNVFLSTSGAMANENAFKIIFQKRYPAARFFAFEKCFSGRTLGMAWVTDKAAYRQGLPKTLDVDYLPFYCSDDHKGSIENTVKVMKKAIGRFPGQHAGIILELIQGENGSWVGNTEFFEAIIKVCHENNISVLVDEVQTFARTHELFAFQHFKLDKLVDVVSIGKNSQVCATLFKDDHKPKAGLMSQTFTGSSSQIAASYAVIQEILKGEYLGPQGKIEKFHQRFRGHLEKMVQKHPKKISGPFGLGAMVAATFFGGDEAKCKAFTFKLFDNGVLSFMAGSSPTRVRFLMPILAVTMEDIDQVCALIDKTLSEME